MMPKKRYILGDFTKYATGRLATHFTAISDMALYQFSEKLYLDEKHNTHRRHMLLVGHYSRKASGPPVWACATGERICYYSGPGKQVTPLVQDIHSSKVYYDPPFSYIGGSHDYSSQKPGMNPERKLERAVVDSAINFIFLSTGRLDQVFDLVNPDILGHFKLACTNLVRHQKPLAEAGHTSYEQVSRNAFFSSPANERLHPNEPIAVDASNLQLVHRSKSTASPSLGKRQFVDFSDDRTDDLPSGKQSEQISDYETEIHAKYEQETRELRAQLDQRDAKIGATKAKLMREKTKRRDIQTQRNAWKKEYKIQEALAASTAEHAKQEEGGEDWKAMLFDQERKTKNYKVKYIAMKEQKEKWEAEKLRMQGDIVRLRSKMLGQRNTLQTHEIGHVKQGARMANHHQERERLHQELAKEKEARIFWQRKHSSLLASSRNRSLPATTPTGPRNMTGSMQVVRAPLDNKRIQASSRTSGFGESVPLPQGMRR
ncbi:uncharacterized protein J4E84_004104 [Alternaria hordeiaustralica]|uniref:uncharacterized protein n=1 Tax=Alternaria hordeiaustralica TaxID=1187925 RepID=UPI0020C2A484|nr:uncharacterized protein J4E84_004104 [Alternaria hordeiaustralica]KAI4689923.1 hypothetical protein J4E84_004104 [Alternaria hordeiaustralica]